MTMTSKEDIDQLREVMKLLGENLPNILKGVADLANDQKRVAAFATSTAEFFRQLREAGVPEDKAVELTKVFIERANPTGPFGALLSNASPDLGDLGPLLGKGGKGRRSVTIRIGDVDKDEEKGDKEEKDDER